MYLNAVNRQRFKTGFWFFLVFTISYTISWIIINITNVKLISAINLNLFSFWISLVIAAVVLLLEDGQIILHIRTSLSPRSNKIIVSCVALVIGAILLVFVYSTINFSQIAFEEWSYISPLRIAFFLATFSVALYAPAYILHKTLLRKFKWSIIEKGAFYPVLSAIMLVLLEVVGTITRVDIPYGAIFVVLLGGTLIVFLNERRRISNASSSLPHIDINLKEVLVLTTAIGFNLFIFCSAVGGGNPFLRGDMWGEAHAVAFMNKYGLNAYLASPVEGYPPFYPLFWSAILELLPFPYLNGLLIIAFFNHLFSLLAFYLMARILFKDSKMALLAVILWTTLSGFSWVNLVPNPPTGALSGNQLLGYISTVSQHFGVNSGSIVSPIFADDHALTRLWSLGLLFLSIAALLKSYFSENNLKESLTIFSICFIQIMLGHITEVPVIALVLFLLILIGGKTSSRFKKAAFLAALISSSISAFFIALIYGLNVIYILISLMPLLAVIFGVIFRSVFDILSRVSFRNSLGKLSQKVKAIFFILFLYVYGLMWLAFLGSHVSIGWSIATVWYSPAVEWGVLGFVSVLTMAWFGLKNNKLQFGLKFAISLFLLQLILLIGLNYLNYNIFYIQTPYPFQPMLFLPVLALIASQAFSALNFKRYRHKLRLFLLVTIVMFVFAFGSLDHILSASFWNTNNGWWWYKPLNPSNEDYQLINFLYEHSSSSKYFVGTFYDWTTPSSYVVYPSGSAVLSEPLMDILSGTNDSREIYILTQTLPINYILVSNDSPLPPATSLSFDGVDDYIEVLDSASLNTSVFTIEAMVKLNAYSPYLCPIVDRANPNGGYSFWIGGEGHSKGQLILNGGFGNDAQSNLLQVKLGEWTDIAVVCDGNATTFYKNGVPEAVTGYQFHDIGSLTTQIGSERWAFRGQFFDGDISNVRIYNRALNESELSLLYHQDSSILEGLSLWFNLNYSEGVIARDFSGKGNNGEILGAQWHLNSYLASAINAIAPIFANNKCKLYSLSQLNLTKTDMLPTSNDFLTAEEIIFNGDLTYTDKLNNTVHIQDVNGEIRPSDNGMVTFTVRSSYNATSDTTVLAPFIHLVGNITLIEMKSTWKYFASSGCIADKITISGEASFQVFNTVKNRIYTESFSYKGKYTASPLPDSLRPDNAKELINSYLQTNYVDPLKTITSNFGILWTMLIAIVLFFALAPLKTMKCLGLPRFHFKRKTPV